jgi:hypothetical protein
MNDNSEALTVRLSPELHHELKLYKRFTGNPVNGLVVRLLQEYLEGEGHREITAAMTESAKRRYADALRRLADPDEGAHQERVHQATEHVTSVRREALEMLAAQR